MTREVNSNKTKTLPERPVKLARKCPRRRGVAVDEHRRGPTPGGFVSRERAVRRIDLKRPHELL
jgi:hypothetical protein